MASSLGLPIGLVEGDRLSSGEALMLVVAVGDCKQICGMGIIIGFMGTRGTEALTLLI
jgi:hypothetical protein